MTFMNPDRAAVIRQLVNPRSVAVIGASADFSKVNGRPLKHLIEKGYGGEILPVNPKYREIAGLACYPDIASLPHAADLAIIALPAALVCDCVLQLGRKGTRAAVIFSSGFGEMGPDGKALERELADTAKAARVILLGPNCLGFINAFENVYATFSQYADGETGAGPVAFVTQSGAFGTAIAALARRRGLGLGYFVNTGNQADLDFAELMMAVVEDPRVKVAAGYLEGISDGEALVKLAQNCRALGKPLILTKVGRMESGARAAASHTGALAVSDAVFDAVARQYGILRARNEEQMLDMMEVFCQPRRAGGNGLGIATQSGGAGVMMADRAEEVGLSVPHLGTQTQAKLASVMPAFGAAGNPVDVTGQFVARPELLSESVVAMLDDPAIDVAIVWLQLMTGHVDALLKIFAEIRDSTEKPFLVCWVAAPETAVKGLGALGIPVFSAGERAVEAAAALARYGQSKRKADVGPEKSRLSPPMPTAPSGVQPTVEASALLAAAGIPMANVALAGDEDAAVALWRGNGGAVALKVESPDILHKSDMGGLILGVDSEAAIREGYRALVSRAKENMPKARLSGILVQEMSQGHVELVVGVSRDPVFGMIVMVGLGGVLVEVLKDVTFRKAPFDRHEAALMLSELRMGAILDGVRGKPAVDRDEIAELLAKLSQWADAMAPRLLELDLNPVLVGKSGPRVVDCVMILNDAPPEASSR
ncbi:acetate--CoA ligase family protein [Martelella lutilitoris]|uniref:Acetate--CoA ligase family protein n=1 Tax=Martelella lutilitoris TaxID=2583532 RepID=A0A5C4JRG6_9HYPH|nr:acetate--CoA ligase family protein [Martelella lutilitoris]TNB47724.1 acetate--CoA ligase family protein [Martelella lutilitoris]